MSPFVLIKFVIATVVFFIILTGYSFAAVKAGTFTLSPMVGLHKIDGSMDLDADTVYGLGFGCYYSSKWAVEADVRFTPAEVERTITRNINI